MRYDAVLAVLILLAGGIAPAMAQRGRDRGPSVRPLDQVLPHVREAYPGTFYDAEGPFRGGDGRMHYRLKWLTPGGRIIWLDTDAATGRVLGVDRAGPRDAPPDPGRRYVPREDFRGPGRARDGFEDRSGPPPRRFFDRDGGERWRPDRGDRLGPDNYHGGPERGHRRDR